MICRIWHGWTTAGNAGAYERLLRGEVLPGIASHAGAGYRGAQLLRRAGDGEVEFVTLIWFESLDAIRAFAGEDPERAVVPPAARALLHRFDASVTHMEVVDPGPMA